jgi:hypothetical protein
VAQHSTGWRGIARRASCVAAKLAGPRQPMT